MPSKSNLREEDWEEVVEEKEEKEEGAADDIELTKYLSQEAMPCRTFSSR
jgi:hypothetical protein